MEMQIDAPALSTEHQVREVALLLMRMCGTIHDALRKSTSASTQDVSTLPYALLTEEYALRSRANTLLIEAKRLARPGLGTSQQAILDVLQELHFGLESSTSLQQLAELINSVMLFANSLMSMNGRVILFLLNELKQTVNSSVVA